MGGQVVDASIVRAPVQRNRRDENEAIKSGEVPGGWKAKARQRAQKDVDARWTRKRGKSDFGYKNHVSVDRRHKLVRRYEVTDAAVHDSQLFDNLLDEANTCSKVRARVEHVFAFQESAMGGKLVRTIGIARARTRIGMMNLVYNMRRLVWLARDGIPARA